MDKTVPEDESQHTCFEAADKRGRHSEPGDLEAIDGEAAFRVSMPTVFREV
jgi:hypothetical protein